MSIKNPIWMLIIVIIAFVLGFYNYLSWDIVIVAFVAYVFSLGMWVETEEIKLAEGLKDILDSKIENVEKHLSIALHKVVSEERIKKRIEKRRKEIIDWLSRF